MPKNFSQQVASWQRELDRRARTMANPPRQSLPQSPEDRHGPGYDNDCSPAAWYRAPNESAEGKPGFDSSQARLSTSKGRKVSGYADASPLGPKPKVKP
jgi:hypothetical protein